MIGLRISIDMGMGSSIYGGGGTVPVETTITVDDVNITVDDTTITVDHT